MQEFELEQCGSAAAKFHALALHKKWICRVCGDTPSRDELDRFMDNDGICPGCQARYVGFMRD